MIQRCAGVALALLVALAPASWAESRRTLVRQGWSEGSPAPHSSTLREESAELIISYCPSCSSADRSAIEHGCGAVHCRDGYGGAYQRIALAPGRDARRELERLRKNPHVRFVEPNGTMSMLALATDPFFSPYQWNLADTGFGIHVPSAWDRSTGTGVVVAVIDTGIAFESYAGFNRAPDLAQTSFVPGWDFVHNTAHPNDDNGHGTHVAGIIAESSNNGYGCAGVAPGASLMPIKVLGADGTGPFSAVADGIRYAADHGAQVINISLGTSQYSDAVRDAVQYARGKGIVIVAAAGNDGTNTPVYPAALDGVISVGATRYDGQVTYYSNYGPTLSVVAPGGDPSVDQNRDGFPDGILQQTIARDRPGQFRFLFMAGTSQAAPHVAGVAALVLSAHPDFTADEVQEAIEKTATDLGPPGRDDHYGSGLVNAAAAVNYDPRRTLLGWSSIGAGVDDSPFNFEQGSTQGWDTTDATRATLLNTDQLAYQGRRSLQVSLQGISDYLPGIIRVAPDGGAVIPAGHTVTAYLQAATGGSLAARVVLYDSSGQPVVGPFVPLVPGRWIPVSVTVPPWSNGPFRWLFLHFRAPGASSYTGTCYLDSVGW